MPLADDLLRKAIDEGRIRRIPAGVRVLPEPRDLADPPRPRPETCGAGHLIGRRPSLDQIEGDGA